MSILVGLGSLGLNACDSAEMRAAQERESTAQSCDLMTAAYTVTPMTLSSGQSIEEGPFFTLDGKRIVYVNNRQGWEMDIATGIERCLTCEFSEPAEVHRIYPMVDGSYAIAGPSQASEEALQGVHEALTRIMGDELWWMSGRAGEVPQALGSRVFEGFAVSRSQMKIGWSNSPIQLAFTNDGRTGVADALNTGFSVYVADLQVDAGVAQLINVERVHEEPSSFTEVQDFLPGDAGLTMTTYWSLERRLTPSDPVAMLETFIETQGYINLLDIDAEAWTLDLSTGQVTNQSNSADTYDEFEGIHPGGLLSAMETSQGVVESGGVFGVALSFLKLDGTGKNIRTFPSSETGILLDPAFHPNGRMLVGGYGLNNDTNRVIVTRPQIAFMTFDCPQ